MPVETSKRHRRAALWFVAAAVAVAVMLFLLTLAARGSKSGTMNDEGSKLDMRAEALSYEHSAADGADGSTPSRGSKPAANRGTNNDAKAADVDEAAADAMADAMEAMADAMEAEGAADDTDRAANTPDRN